MHFAGFYFEIQATQNGFIFNTDLQIFNA